MYGRTGRGALPQAGAPTSTSDRASTRSGDSIRMMSSFLDRPVATATVDAGFMRVLGFLFPVCGSALLFTLQYRTVRSRFTVAQTWQLCGLAVTAIKSLEREGRAIQMR